MARVKKQRIADEIAARLGLPKDRFGPGSKEHRGLLSGVAAALGLETEGRKPELAQRIVRHLGQRWGAECTSTGDTVTAEALARILRGLRLRSSDQREVEFDEQVRTARRRLQRSGAPPRGTQVPRQVRSTSTFFVRSANVVAYVLERAGGVCELCQSRAPFNREDGTPYLEVHHVHMLRAGGADTVENAVALCPNCHREAHHGCDQTGIANRLRRAMSSGMERTK